MHTPSIVELLIFDVVTHVGDGRVSRGQPSLPSHPQESGVPELPNFWGSPVFMLMPTPFNAERPESPW